MNESIVLGGGCFWCLEAVYRRVTGVTHVTNGYAGGTKDNPSYWDLHTPTNDHAEVVKVDYDSTVISLDTVLSIFWALHNPTTPNQQGADVGAAYRSLILYSSDKQKCTAEKSRDTVGQPIWNKPIVTEIKQLETFWPAEEDQQDWFNKHPEQAYCQIVINPKLVKLKKKFSHLLKDI